MTEKEFKVNDYITLKLEKDKTNIYVNNEMFGQCSRLFINIFKDEVSEYKEFSSIDEASELYKTFQRRL